MRYLPHNDRDRQAMLKAIGVASIDDLFADVPKAARLSSPLDLPSHKSELEVDRLFRDYARRNIPAAEHAFFVGCGAYRHHIPASVDYIIQRGEFLTAYTPYQPEIAQGTLQYLFEFQTQIANLLGCDVANASLYDGSTACGEAILMARRITRGRKKAILAGGLHAHYGDVVETITQYGDEQVIRLQPLADDPARDLQNLIDSIDEETACVVVQTPDLFGHLHDLGPLAEAAHAKGALLVAVVTEVVSLGAVKSPGEMGADIVVAEGQSIGNGLNFGGPYLGLFATREKYVRQMPGRLAGQTRDADGKRGFVLTLSTREQHIRREKATSNICTNSGLCALAFTVHMTLLGEKGLRQLAMINHKKATQLRAALAGIDGVEVLNQSYFNELCVRLPGRADALVEALAGQKILAGVPASRLYPQRPELANILILAITETVSEADIALLAGALRDYLATPGIKER
ncbi:putative glycine dehydrogenase (decarboxylating) subunit 1 [Iodidimonas nitroreducens]|uniref:Probable glycine dehydrogenase (decarboxylating) subunit 1 n=1 Tax=Iodidimonas nitroreducens TaxID=1236968 RepID=A0A5A7N8W7_9PROT|nr:aminomethyl-transferring glycine dehydrogenase subunit GcvPA [Iodidimonas nitroreducens]GAK33944.1 putative glycine dehydrogenase [decarboxylating] subunit 1 [alpha proteobacterium Q-1]GER03860.1 putative glycine dehydrogenase (decarboxylating) subunit 1 [Iodidimonas nitroreducens]